MVQIRLGSEDADRIRRPVEGQGGLQSLLRMLQRNLSVDGTLTLSMKDVERIRRYSAKYGQGGFQDRIKPIVKLLEGLPDSTGQSNLDTDW